jgi:hypothetical protein
VQIERERQYHWESTELLDRAFPDDKLFQRINTTGIEEDSVAEEICRRIREQNKAVEETS